MKVCWAAAAFGLAIMVANTALAQNLSLRAPQWAQALVAADITPTTGGRAVLEADGIDLSVRVTIAPNRGGVARVIRYDLRGSDGQLAVRRFTGHPSTGWWLWGGDTPRVTAATNAQRTELANLTRSAMGVAATLGGSGGDQTCPNGEQAFIEVALGERATSFNRNCLSTNDAAGRLASRLSEIAGSRTEEELAAAAVAELLEVDRAFAAKAQADGVPAAFTEYAAEDALMLSRENIVSGRAGVEQRFGNWPEGARLEWSPEIARVSSRGDMGWTWGNSAYTAPDGTRMPGRYVSIWTRDAEGRWRFAFDAAVD